jgi:hypothetical protein
VAGGSCGGWCVVSVRVVRAWRCLSTEFVYQVMLN